MTQKDRKTQNRERQNPTHPLPPANLEVLFAFDQGLNAFDLRWDDPTVLGGNKNWDIIGVNVYRSNNSELGPYFRLNDEPLGAPFYRDATLHEEVVDEDVTNSFLAEGKDDEGGKWIFRVSNYPIVKPDSENFPANHPTQVIVKIDGQVVPAEAINGATGEVQLRADPVYDTARNKLVSPILPNPESTVTCTYHYNLNVVTNMLDRKVFYRVTTVGYRHWDGVDENGDPIEEELLETPLAWTEAKTIQHMENMDYIWREGIRRNAWILDQGGERVWAFIRKWTGELCDCWDHDYLHPRSDCHVCFPPGTLVRTATGYRPIEEIEVGDQVLSSDGSFQKVTATMENDYEGPLHSIFSSVSTTPILATPSHPFKILRGDHTIKKGCSPKYCNSYLESGDGIHARSYDVRKLPSGNWWARCQVNSLRGGDRKALGTYPTKNGAKNAIFQYREANVLPGHVLEWDDAENIKEGDWLVPKWPSKIVGKEWIEIPATYLKNSSKGPERLGPSKFKINEEFLWMVGIYLAEGSVGTRQIQFSLHDKEVEFQNRLVRFFEKHGYHPKIRSISGSKGTNVDIGSTTLSSWFKEWMGPNCYNKKIPEELMLLPPEMQYHILKGVYDGDGWKGGRSITQTSEILALQLCEILHRMGKQPLVHIMQSNVLTPIGNKRAPAYCVNWEREDFHHDHRKGRWDFKDEEILSKVYETSKVAYKGKVYNLEVDGDHTYVVNGVVVHNCYATGYVGGYEGPYELKIAPQDADKTIVFDQTGFSLEHIYEVWTGPTPMLSQRDFIVKKNNDRYSIGPVRMPTNRGNILQQHFSIDMIDSLEDIRQEVPLNLGNFDYPETRAPTLDKSQVHKDGEPIPNNTNDQITDHEDVPDEVEERGRTPTYDNITKTS